MFVSTLQQPIKWKQPKYHPVMNGQIVVYLTRKWDEVLLQMTAWIQLENTMVNGKNHVQKTTYCMIPLI